MEQDLIPIDNEYGDFLIKEVEESDSFYSITLSSGVSFGFDKSYGVEPRVGDIARLYPSARMGSVIRGIFINGKKVFYRTVEEQKLKWKKEVELGNEKKKKDFEGHKEEYAKRIAQLPTEFQRRIKRFQNNNFDFEWQNLSYELLCCEQAVLFVNRLKTIEALDKFYKAEYKKQKELVPELSKGHSGNTFGFAVLLAKHFIVNPKVVEKEHGAMCPLMGCKEYGCVPKEGEQ